MSLPSFLGGDPPATMSGDTEIRPHPIEKLPLTYMLVPDYMSELLLNGFLILLICFLVLMLIRFWKKEPEISYGTKILVEPEPPL